MIDKASLEYQALVRISDALYAYDKNLASPSDAMELVRHILNSHNKYIEESEPPKAA